MAAAEAARFVANPVGELRHFGMMSQLFDSIKITLKLLLCQHLVNLGMTRPADSNHLSHCSPIEVALVSFVVVAGSRNQMMPGQPLRTLANCALARAMRLT